MKYILATLGLLALLPVVASAAERPNVLVILADDLGYSDIGCYGGEIETPNLDALAKNGLRFTQFYNTARCWPTRGALLTGYYAQQIRRDNLPGIPSGGRGKRPQWARLLPDMLKPLGYRSYHSGKWHVDGLPLQCGFDHSYYVQDQGRFFNPKVHYEDDQKLPPVEPGGDYYATNAIADHAVRTLKEHAEKHGETPFFHYLAFTAPHFPLHGLPEDIAKYRNQYRAGWEKVRDARWQRIQEMGLVDGVLSAVEPDVGPPYHFPKALEILGPGEVNRPLPWETLTAAQQEFQATKMAIHAAMIDRVDRDIGRVLAQLRAMGALDNTLILFLSDNGGSAEIMVRDDGHDPTAAPGSAATYLCLGPGWSTTSNTPFRRHKTWVHEGGISTPLIAHWPAGISAKGELRQDVGHVIDIVPTILDIAGGAPLKTWNDQPVPPAPGKSLVPAFAKDDSVKRDALWWSHEGNRALRVGNWKLVSARDDDWELYDLHGDRTEQHNLAAQHPDKVDDMRRKWEQLEDEFRQLATRDLPQSSLLPRKELILPGKSFFVADRPAFIFYPPREKRRKPQPWILYAPTLPGLPDRHEKWMHEQFLAAGVAVAGIDIGESFGSPRGQKLYNALYRELTTKQGFAQKPCLLGRSRGGLMITSWAAAHPEKVAGIAGIYPVLDLTAYPGVDKAAGAYRLTAEQLQNRLAKHNPIENVEALARAGVPAFFIHGDSDKVVPLETNSAEFVRRYKAAGAESLAQLVIADGQGHNYWDGFFHCQELIDFAIKQATAATEK
ncbi:Arylsulfatase [Symmachiella dynata]|uniref:Arylsulfatase n=1 Tax=Symmachiella dynata TaxID=2527995 RepID=A0A517ZGL8_9PLAN|nr:sulfatase-like hydrolase/transferase [Symmachiella dynata]QDU41627.1 Arylsulfatase [Symmachiella dynata]